MVDQGRAVYCPVDGIVIDSVPFPGAARGRLPGRQESQLLTRRQAPARLPLRLRGPGCTPAGVAPCTRGTSRSRCPLGAVPQPTTGEPPETPSEPHHVNQPVRSVLPWGVWPVRKDSNLQSLIQRQATRTDPLGYRPALGPPELLKGSVQGSRPSIEAQGHPNGRSVRAGNAGADTRI